MFYRDREEGSYGEEKVQEERGSCRAVVTVIAPLWNASSVMYSSRDEVTLEEFKECINSSLIP